MRALVIHPGTQHAFRLAVELHRLDALAGLHTGFGVPSGGVLEGFWRRLPTRWRRKFANRRIEELPHHLLHLQPALELRALTRSRRGMDAQAVFHWRNERFQNSVSERALEAADVVIGFDTSSWILTRRCRKIGKPFVMVQTTCHPDSKRAAYEQLKTQYPEWMERVEERSPEVRQAEQEEHENATRIVVSSSFTRQTLVEQGISSSKIRLNFHGVDCERFIPEPASGAHPFRFVFVGAVNAAKGVPLLLEAWRQLQPTKAELWIIGPVPRQAASLLPTLPGLRFFGGVPQIALPHLLRECDVFVFPSYFEGFGLVILQAMACGLPVISTTATAAPDLYQQGRGGWIIPPGDAGQLVNAMNHCLARAGEMKIAGRTARKIAERFNWAEYGRRWLPILEESKENGGRSAKIEAGGQLEVPHRESFTGVTAPMRVLLVHPGTQYSGRLAAQLQKRGVLTEYHTSLAYSDQGWLENAVSKLPADWRGRLANRRISGLPAHRLRTSPWHELVALASLRCGINQQRVFQRRNLVFQRAISDSAIKNADAVIGFDTSSWIIAERARKQGRLFVLDQSVGHPKSYAEVAKRLSREYPEWPEKAPIKNQAALAYELQEHAAASLIVVPSRFVAKTLEENGVDPAKIRVNPFGVDLECFKPAKEAPSLAPLRFVFAGSLQARKGLPLLLRAWNRLPAGHGAELMIAGAGKVPSSVLNGLPGSIRFLGKLSQAQLADSFRQSHVFVFPSFFEGLAQVQIEAAACGLPVIGTANSGCEEIIRDGATGLVLPTGDMDALIETLRRFIAAPELALEMRQRLLAERTRWSWDFYGERWVDLLAKALMNRLTS